VHATCYSGKPVRNDLTKFIYSASQHEPDPAAGNVFPILPEKVCLSLSAGISQHYVLYQQNVEKDLCLRLLSADTTGLSLLQYGKPIQNQSVQRSLAGKATTDLALFEKRWGM